jgi:hypothetical protein
MRPDVIFLDFEASGLHSGSFPIQIGVCDDALNSRSWLIRPRPDWTLSDWSIQSESVHGIPYARLLTDGSPVPIVVTELEQACRGRTVFTDNPVADGRWLLRLFASTGRDPFHLRHIADALDEVADDGDSISDLLGCRSLPDESAAALRILFPRPHRADEDAMSMAAEFRVRLDPSFATDVRLAASSWEDEAWRAGCDSP